MSCTWYKTLTVFCWYMFKSFVGTIHSCSHLLVYIYIHHSLCFVGIGHSLSFFGTCLSQSFIGINHSQSFLVQVVLVVIYWYKPLSEFFGTSRSCSHLLV